MKISEIAEQLSCRLEGDGDAEIVGIATLEAARTGDLSFLSNPRYAVEAKTTQASGLIVGHDFPFSGIPLLHSPNPYLTFAKALDILHSPRVPSRRIDPSAVIAASAKLGSDIGIGANAYVGPDAVVGDRVIVGPNCSILEEAVIGDDSRLAAGTVICQGVQIGKRCIIQSNAVIGSDGFGYARQDDGSWYRIQQCGTVTIEDDVEIGAGSTVDRPALGETRVLEGVKIDNLVHIGHSCSVGKNSLLCAQVGLAGSTKIGRNVILAGQVGSAGHLTINDNAAVTAQAGVGHNVKAGTIVSGSPAFDHKTWLKSTAIFARLPELQKSIRHLEKRIDILENSLNVISEN